MSDKRGCTGGFLRECAHGAEHFAVFFSDETFAGHPLCLCSREHWFPRYSERLGGELYASKEHHHIMFAVHLAVHRETHPHLHRMAHVDRNCCDGRDIHPSERGTFSGHVMWDDNIGGYVMCTDDGREHSSRTHMDTV